MIDITFILQLIMVCAFMCVSLALTFKFVIEAILQYKSFQQGIEFVLEETEDDEEDDLTGR